MTDLEALTIRFGYEFDDPHLQEYSPRQKYFAADQIAQRMYVVAFCAFDVCGCSGRPAQADIANTKRKAATV